MAGVNHKAESNGDMSGSRDGEIKRGSMKPHPFLNADHETLDLRARLPMEGCPPRDLLQAETVERLFKLKPAWKGTSSGQ